MSFRIHRATLSDPGLGCPAWLTLATGERYIREALYVQTWYGWQCRWFLLGSIDRSEQPVWFNWEGPANSSGPGGHLNRGVIAGEEVLGYPARLPHVVNPQAMPGGSLDFLDVEFFITGAVALGQAERELREAL